MESAARQDGASQLNHYLFGSGPESLTGAAAYCIAPYLAEVRDRHWRLALTELRTGVHWGAESRDRIRGAARRPAHERFCMHCLAVGQPGQVKVTEHMVFRCSLYSGFRCSYPHLFARPPPREAPQHALALAGTPPQPPAQLALPLWTPTPAAPPHQPPDPPPPPPRPLQPARLIPSPSQAQQQQKLQQAAEGQRGTPCQGRPSPPWLNSSRGQRWT